MTIINFCGGDTRAWGLPFWVIHTHVNKPFILPAVGPQLQTYTQILVKKILMTCYCYP